MTLYSGWCEHDDYDEEEEECTRFPSVCDMATDAELAGAGAGVEGDPLVRYNTTCNFLARVMSGEAVERAGAGLKRKRAALPGGEDTTSREQQAEKLARLHARFHASSEVFPCKAALLCCDR